MAWGLVDSNSFGDFFQPGDYVGWNGAEWSHAAWVYLSTEASDAERREFSVRATGFSMSEVSKRFFKNDGPLAPQLYPVEYKLEKRVKTLGSLIELTNQLLVVDAALKGLIEELEPSVHHFWPMRIVQPKGEPFPKSYFGIRIGRSMDSFVSDQSDPKVFLERDHIAGGTFFVAYDHSKKGYAKLALSSEIVGAAHLWRETRLWGPLLFISDRLQSEIVARGLRIPKHYQLKSV